MCKHHKLKLKNHKSNVSEVEIELNIMRNTPIELMYTSFILSHDSSKCKLLKKVLYKVVRFQYNDQINRLTNKETEQVTEGLSDKVITSLLPSNYQT
ncbi:ras-interacting protein RIP3-like [Vespula squamosa]|uniref:Ras-interacting protein RIP3-like n=1 Tax=Vespula squamosa TaxID=30214 RepID=A0ABD2AFY2_VESSQ